MASLTDKQLHAIREVAAAVVDERKEQHAKWGEQNHPYGTSRFALQSLAASGTSADEARASCQDAFREGRGTWAHIAWEEFAEALEERDPVKLRKELVQAAAVLNAWVEAIDRREVTRD